MIPCFHQTTAGATLDIEAYLALGHQAGFTMADLDATQIFQLEQAKGVSYVQELLSRYEMTWAAFGLPVNLSGDALDAKEPWLELEKLAQTAQRYGVTRCTTWLWPSIEESPVPYACKLIQIVRRSADILAKEGMQLGLEFVGPHHLRHQKYPFIYNIPDLLLLLGAVERDNVGVLLDSYHWYTTGQSLQELGLIPVEKIVHVHLNDTLESPEKAHDQRRLLPGEGVIDLVGFLRKLDQLGYTGPLSLEVLRQEGPTDPPEAVAKRAFVLVQSLLEKL